MVMASPDTFAAWTLILISQAASVIGDAFGQRTVRVVHKQSRRRMIMSFVFVSSVQILVVMSVLQLALPASVTGTVYIHSEPSPCYKEYSEEGCCQSPGPSCPCVVTCNTANSTCTRIPCPSQGPGSIPRFLGQHPFLLINGVANTVYYVAESMVYKEPLGLVLLVMASLSATLLFKPVGTAFGLEDSPIPAGVLLLGGVGALMCVVEKDTSAGVWGDGAGGGGPPLRTIELDSDEDGAPPVAFQELRAPDDYASSSHGSVGPASGSTSRAMTPLRFDSQKTRPLTTAAKIGRVFSSTLRILPAFLVLALCYCVWFVFMRVFNDLYRCNAWGFNSMDQITLPVFVYPLMAVLSMGSLRHTLEADAESAQEPFLVSLKHAWKELTSSWQNFATVFTYRGIINARAVCYSYLAILYDLDVVYLELTLVRVITAWVGAVLLSVLVPSFIKTLPEERRRILHPVNLGLKLLGSCAVVVALLLVTHK